jgi:hypothetical protein
MAEQNQSAPGGTNPDRTSDEVAARSSRRASNPNHVPAGPLRGSEGGSTVDRRSQREPADSSGQDGDLSDGDEGSATGSRTPGQDGR